MSIHLSLNTDFLGCAPFSPKSIGGLCPRVGKKISTNTYHPRKTNYSFPSSKYLYIWNIPTVENMCVFEPKHEANIFIQPQELK